MNKIRQFISRKTMKLQTKVAEKMLQSKNKEGAVNITEIIIILIIACALAVIFKDILIEIMVSLGTKIKESINSLWL